MPTNSQEKERTNSQILDEQKQELNQLLKKHGNEKLPFFQGINTGSKVSVVQRYPFQTTKYFKKIFFARICDDGGDNLGPVAIFKGGEGLHPAQETRIPLFSIESVVVAT